MTPSRFVLASASPRRREILRSAGLAFDVDVSEVDESFDETIAPTLAARVLAERKARAVAFRNRGRVVLAADTIVALEVLGSWRYFGKPADASEARRMLRSLSNSRHAVVTGVCALHVDRGLAVVDSETTWVTMRAIGADEVEAYVASLEWRDKAGGYAIQESADRFVEKLEGGGFDNVVGLPLKLALDCLSRATLA
ncbi:MAG: Maf family protein [Planctomycetota bacterium]|nr:Maf family protein [Planctomycetota bacterium]